MKEYFLTHEEDIIKGMEYECWKIPSGAIVSWEDNKGYLENIYPNKRYGIMMGGLYETTEEGRKVYEVRVLEILSGNEKYIVNGTKTINNTQTAMTHLFRYDRYSNELIGYWVENNDFTIPEGKEYWLNKVKYLGTLENGDFRISIIEDGHRVNKVLMD